VHAPENVDVLTIIEQIRGLLDQEPDDQRLADRLGLDHIDRDFVVRLLTFLHERKVTRNGRAAATENVLSLRPIFNVLDCARTMISWACRPEVQQLPITMGNPFSEDLVGHRPTEDPLRPVVFPPDLRMQIVGQMDAWQLCQLCIAMVLPLFDEIRYFFYITNDWEIDAEDVVFEANDRCNQENLIAQLAGGVRALSAPVDNLLSNWAYMVATALAWNLKA
jgi:hypothetical protein